MSDLNVTITIGKEKYRTEINNGKHTLIADEPESVGGQDAGLNPHELLLSSLGACTAITLRMYADRKQWDLEELEISLKLEVVPSSHQQTTYIRSHIRASGNLDDDQKQRLLQIAKLCPVHKILSNPVVIESNVI